MKKTIACIFLAGLFVLGIICSAHAATDGGTSLLMGASERSQLLSWLGGGELTMLYEPGAGNFHANVDNMGPTILIMDVTTGGNRYKIGGYNPQSWRLPDATNPQPYNETVDLADRTAFIFNLSGFNMIGESVKFDQVSGALGKYQTFNHPAFGPTFGLYQTDNYGNPLADLMVYASLVEGGLVANSYGLNDSLLNLFTGGVVNNISFDINALEVYSYDSTPVPVPASLLLLGSGLFGLLGFRRVNSKD